MEFDVALDPRPGTVSAGAAAAQSAGRRGAWVIEAKHDPFLLLNGAAAVAPGLALGTAVAIGFARSPMVLATLANDLQLTTRGKFTLGLGTQVRPHIERRFSMPWGRPLGRMREMIGALHAIWDSWQFGSRLAFKGQYYQHTLMTEAFSPGPNAFGRPPVILGALGPAMTQLAGEMADGLLVHRFMSEKYLTEVTLPSLQRGLAKRERPLDKPFELTFAPFVVVVDDDWDRASEAIRHELAFHASTPAYRTLLELHGWQERGERLHALSRQGEWEQMRGIVDEEMLNAFAVVCGPDDVETTIEKRFGPFVHRSILFPEEYDPVGQVTSRTPQNRE